MLLLCSHAALSKEIDASLRHSLQLARTEAATIGENLWPSYSAVPFDFLLTLEDREVLFCRPQLVDGFTALGKDPITGCDMQERASQVPKNMLAAMYAAGAGWTIVMGTPESTGRSHADWARTIHHEHFHQYQNNFDRYFERQNALGLAGDDTSGMWMLEYPFPYRSQAFNKAFKRSRLALQRALTSSGRAVRKDVANYLSARAELEASVPAKDWRYLELELWYEGVARWTDLVMAERSSSPPLQQSGAEERTHVVASLASLDPRLKEREIVYEYGAAEAMLLQRCVPGWQASYPNVLALGALVKAIEPDKCQ